MLQISSLRVSICPYTETRQGQSKRPKVDHSRCCFQRACFMFVDLRRLHTQTYLFMTCTSSHRAGNLVVIGRSCWCGWESGSPSGPTYIQPSWKQTWPTLKLDRLASVMGQSTQSTPDMTDTVLSTLYETMDNKLDLCLIKDKKLFLTGKHYLLLGLASHLTRIIILMIFCHLFQYQF